MRRARVITSTLVLVATFAPSVMAKEESPDAYVIVTRAVVALLPEPMHSFFEARTDAVEKAAIDAALPANAADTTESGASGHHVLLDALSVDNVGNFPQDQAAAMHGFQQRGVRDGGELPWMILRRHSALVRAFEEGVADDVIAETGILLHYVTDGTLPFNTIADRDGRSSRSLRWLSEEAGAVAARHQTVRRRVQVEFIRRNRDRFTFEVRLFPKRYRVADDEDVFGTLLAAHAAVPELVRIDLAIIAELKITDASAFLAVADRYYDHLAMRAGSIMETRLEEGVLLGAGLIGAAWAEAGSPAFHASGVVSAESLPPRTDESPPLVGYVASRNSTVYHKAGCAHAARIKPANIVSYDSLDAAKQTGRKPCKSCFRPRP